MKFRVPTIFLFLVCLAFAEAQEQTKSFSDPRKSYYLSIQVLRGNVVVVGTEGSDVSTSLGLWPTDLTQEPFGGGFSRSQKEGRSRAVISIRESENKMSLNFTAEDSGETLYARVPRTVNLKIVVSGHGSVALRGTEGEIDVECLQGKIFLDRIRGPVVAHTLNQSLEARFSALVPGKPNFLSSLNGDVKLFLPKDSEVSFELDFFNGEVVTSMPITLLPLAEGKTSKKRSDFEAPSTAETVRKATHFQIKTHNGNIHIDNYLQ
jgi:hypothetical protein